MKKTDLFQAAARLDFEHPMTVVVVNYFRDVLAVCDRFVAVNKKRIKMLNILKIKI